MAQQSASHLDEIADLQSEGHYLSKKFQFPDADAVFQSIDKVRFAVYKKELAFSSGGFPPAEFISDTKELIDLPERAIILDLLFSFTRPQRFPDIHTLGIETLIELGDAAEKYEVFAAIMACKILLRVNIPTHPLRVFQYAGKYEYSDLMDDAAPFILDTPLLRILEFNMSERYFKAWVAPLLGSISEHLRNVAPERSAHDSPEL
ncbi:hypothetical protein BDN72DRAFT_902877 [Pluteus cervinus]|uniref:Uncharacterized protein n=1 Tax=Pluteus cervinus TaxID=181527 RepID=A0ACD3ABR9_9AGAR|nr:hypothetical protein BDN72DRAFT_902877 [Pluteus cervinus]